MRRVGLLVIGAWVAVVGLSTPALAEPSPTPLPSAVPGETVCTINDSRLVELSGIVALPDGGYVVENDSNEQAAAMRVFFLDSKCKLSRQLTYPTAARDPEDLAVASDGTVWVADTGDNFTNPPNERRDTIALWKVPPGGGAPILHRLAYPDGKHDAEALLFGPGDVPIIVTKDPSGTAQLYQPAEALQPNTKQGVPLGNVGSWKPRRTGTANFLGAAGQVLVTGAAQSPDRKRFVLRTYSDAYEWDAPDGDIVKAIKGEPRITPLPNEPQGEGITYSPDGKSFLTCSDQTGPSRILRYQPTSGAPAAAATEKPAKKADTRSWYKKLTLPQIVDIVAGVGVLGLILVVVGVIGIRRSRKARRQAAKAAKARDNQPADGASGDEDERPTAYLSSVSADQPPPRTGGTYGGGGRSYAQPDYGSGNVYGGGYRQPGYDQGNGRGAGREEFSQPGYHPEYDGDDRYHDRF